MSSARGGILCPGGHACPDGAECLSQGRCECTTGSAWTCTRLGCGISNYSVSCGNGTACPANSTCSGAGCLCDVGYLPTDGDGSFCTGQCAPPNWSCRRSVPGCGASAFTVACAGGGFCPMNSTCTGSSCQCAPGFVPTACDGAACSEYTPCAAPYWFCAPE